MHVEQKSLMEFQFNSTDRTIRVEMVNNQPYFLARDICDVLELKRTDDIVDKLDDDEKLMRKTPASGQNRDMWFINESGLYNLIFRSNKPEAKAFRKWVTSDVLPAIRKTGCYVPKGTGIGLPKGTKCRHNRLTASRLNEILADIALIPDGLLRMRLVEKLMGGKIA